MLFDLDGTLLDSFAAHFEAFRVMFARFGIPLSKESFVASYSPDWYHTYRAMGLPSRDWAAANSYWLELAEQQTPKLLPGVAEALAKVHSNYKLGLITSGSKTRVLRDLQSTGIKALFDSIITGDDVQKPKPSPEGLELALSKLGVEVQQAIYIGDTAIDYETARAAQMEFIGIPSAFESLGTDPSLLRIENINDLFEILDGHSN